MSKKTNNNSFSIELLKANLKYHKEQAKKYSKWHKRQISAKPSRGLMSHFKLTSDRLSFHNSCVEDLTGSINKLK